MNDTQYEVVIHKLEDVISRQNEVINDQYSTILHLEKRLQLYEEQDKVNRL